MPYVFPIHLFNPTTIRPRLVENVLSGGVALSGDEDVVANDGGGRWAVEIGGIELLSPDQVRAWRAWVDEWAGGITEFVLPVPDMMQMPRPLGGAGRLTVPRGLISESADPYFPEATRFRSPAVLITARNGAQLRDTSLRLDVTQGAALKGGEIFSLRHAVKGDRLYRVGRALGEGAYRISPPLREAVPAGARAQFDWPLLRAKLVAGTVAEPELVNGRTATVGAQFVEAT